MKQTRKFWAIALLAVVMCCGFLVGCSGKPTVNLNDYVVMDATGYDGYGTVSASLNFSKLIEDNAEYLTDKSLDTTYFGDQTAQMAAEFIFYNNKPFVLAYTAPENAKNGDKVEFTWNTSEDGIEKLSQVLEVKFKYDNFTYEFKDLKPVKEVDPFEGFTYTFDGFSPYIRCEFEGDIYFDWHQSSLSVSVDKQFSLANGETITFSIYDKYNSFGNLARNYGIVFTRESMTVKVENQDYYPVEDIKDVFSILTEEKKQELKGQIEEYQNERGIYYNGDVTATYVGAVIAYKDDYTPYGPKNEMYVIYHLDNGELPGGYYSYIEVDNFMYDLTTAADGTVQKNLVHKGSTNLPSYYTIGFKENRDLYIGEKTLEELVAEIKEDTHENSKEYDLDKFVATESLEQYIK